MRRLAVIGAMLFAASSIEAQVIERPVSFDAGGVLTVITPSIASRAELRPPTWPVSGDFAEARLFTSNESSFVLAVTRRSGVVERYTISAADRDAIRAAISRLPREAIEQRSEAAGAFVRNQTVLGLLFYGPAFAGAVSDNDAAAIAGYLVVAGGSFFAASEISRRTFITRARSDLSTNMGHNGWLAGWATMFLLNAGDRGQAAGVFVGGLAGAGLGLRFGRNMSEAEGVAAGFGSDIGALIAFGTAEAIRGDRGCAIQMDGTTDCGGRIGDKAEVALILASGIIGYPLGVLYPRNAVYNVTPGDIQALWATTLLGAGLGASLLKESPKRGTAFAATTAGAVLGIVVGDHLLVRRYDHSRSAGSRVFLGTLAGGLMGAGVAAIFDPQFDNPQPIFALATAGGIVGLMASEHYADARPDAGRRMPTIGFNPASVLLLAARAPGNHSLLSVRF